MITKKDLKQIDSIRKEITYFKEKLQKLEEKPVKVVMDSVQASSSEFPYTRHTAKIEGFENPKNIRKYKKMIKSKQYELEKRLNNLEYELNKIEDEDSELRLILRYKYEDGLDNIQTAHAMNDSKYGRKKDYTADSIRMKINRFFEKN